MAHFYISQTAQGLDTGADAANAHSITWLNTSGNWANPKVSGKVGPGDSVHLVGTFSTQVVCQNSGSSGNLIKLLFETGAKFSKAHWSGGSGNSAIYANGLSYLEVDGGSDGIIEATANGTALANQVDSVGVRFDGDQTGNRVHNLTVRNMYVRTAGSGDTTYDTLTTCGVYLKNGALVNCEIDHISVTDSSSGIQADVANGTSALRIHNNTCRNHGIGIRIGTTGAGVSVDNVELDHNDVAGSLVWSGYSGIHQNCQHVFAVQSGAVITNLKVHDNYYHGDMGAFPTSHAFFEGYITAPLVYNNIFYNENTLAGGNGTLVIKGADGMKVMNNTFVSATPGGWTAIGTTTWAGTEVFSMTNNVIKDFNYAYYDGASGASLSAADYNLVYPNTQLFRYGGASGHSYADWTGTGKNTHGKTSNPNLDANYAPQAGSPVIGAGTDLSVYFTTDFSGTTRSIWDIGAKAYAAVATALKHAFSGKVSTSGNVSFP